MTKKFTNTDQYAVPPAAIWGALTTQHYWDEKYAALGADNLEWIAFEAEPDALTVSSRRQVAANIPGFAKKIIGETAEVTQTEKWRREGDRLDCDIEIATKGAPGGTTGTMTVTPNAGGSAWSADFDIHVPIPLLGKKLEGMIQEETAGNFKAEKLFNDDWFKK